MLRTSSLGAHHSHLDADEEKKERDRQGDGIQVHGGIIASGSIWKTTAPGVIRVADYAQWRPVFDEHRGAREAAGLTRCKVQQGADDPNLVSLSCDAADLRKAKDFAASADLKEAMKKAGVTGEPTIFFGKPAPKQCGGD